MIAGQPPAAANPTEGPLGHTSSGLSGKALLPGLWFDDLDHDGCGRADALTSLGTVGQAVSQEEEEPARGPQQGNAAVGVVQVSG